MENFFAGLGFDDRLNSYITSDEYDDQFSDVGFRWDFLLYSVMPIILGWYVVIKKKVYQLTTAAAEGTIVANSIIKKNKK